MNSHSPQNSLVQDVVGALREALGSRHAPLHEPTFAGNEWAYLKECLDTTFVSSVGKFVDRFEADLADYTGAKHAVAVVNGTAALHIALRLAGVNPGDEVLVPSLTFVATANAVAYCGAVPHFVDSEERTLGMDPAALRAYLREHTELSTGLCINRTTNRVIRAMVPMHTFGHPVDLEGILAVSRDYRLELVEDAAESLGSYYYGQHTGTFGRMGILSFNGNKTITTGGGGAILTNDTGLARHAKHVTTTAKLPHAWEYRHDEIAYNYRMPNLNAALGCAQLERLSVLLAAKRALFQRYQWALNGINGVRLFEEPFGCRSNYWLQTLVLDHSQADQRDHVLKAANEAGFMSRPAWVLMHELPFYSACPRAELSQTAALACRLLNLPSGSRLVAQQHESV